MSDQSKPATSQKNNPLHGLTLEAIVTALVAHYGWEQLGQQINIRCFTDDPSVKSSLKFLRRTPWARKQVEELYIRDVEDSSNKSDSADTPWGKWAK